MEANAKKFFSSVAISGLEAVTAKRRYLTKCEPKVMEIDDKGKVNVSRKALLEKPKPKKVNKEAAE